jgi:hypothetical protein
MAWDSGVKCPGGMSYAAPLLPFVQLGELGNDLLGPLEKAFIDHVIRKDPHCVNRIIALLTSISPKLRN